VLLQLIAQGELFSGDEAVVALADRLDAKEAQATAMGVRASASDTATSRATCAGVLTAALPERKSWDLWRKWHTTPETGWIGHGVLPGLDSKHR
jgi:hypothetical protein